MRGKPYLLVILIPGWGLFLLLQNYILTPPLFNNLFFWLGNFFLVILLGLISLGLGEVILARLKITGLTLSEQRLLGAGLGLSVLAYIVFFLGVLKLYYFFTGFILMGLLFFLLWPQIKNILTLSPEGRGSKVRGRDLNSRLTFLFIGLSLLLILLGLLIPPLDYDTLEYHLGVPAQYIKAHGLIYLPYNVFSNFPLHLEMLYTLGLLLNGPILAKMIHFLFLLLILLTIFLLGNRISQTSGLLAALIFVNIPIVSITSAKAYNDLGLTLWGLLSIYVLWQWLEKRDKKFLILAGLFSGSALATKYTAIIFFLIPLTIFILLVSFKEKKGARYPFINATIFIIISLIVVSPWYLKNLAYTGNPIFPFAYKVFGGRNWGEFEAQRFKQQHRVNLSDFKMVLEAPRKIILGEEGDIGVTILFFLPFLLLIKNPPGAIKCFSLYSFFYFLVWAFFTHRISRFLIPTLPLLAIIASYGIFYFLKIKRYIGYSLIALLIIGLAFNSSRLLYQFALIHPLPFISGKDSEKEYLQKIFYLYPAIDFINTSLPQDSKILFIAEARTFYCERPFLVNTPLDKNIMVEIANRSKGPQDILKALREMGLTHVLYNFTEAKRISQSYRSFNWESAKAESNYIKFMEEYLKILFSQEGVIIGQLKPLG